MKQQWTYVDGVYKNADGKIHWAFTQTADRVVIAVFLALTISWISFVTYGIVTVELAYRSIIGKPSYSDQSAFVKLIKR